jgi:predicted adenylyl cyclase CyaB
MKQGTDDLHMETNVEIKARVVNLDKVRRQVEALSDKPCEMIQQEDTFFHAPRGRLKLRTFDSEHGELIYYERDNARGPSTSHYFRAVIPDSNALKAVLSAALGVRGVVRKQRLLYRVGCTRVHLDRVDGLGSFLELEVELGAGHTIEDGNAIASELMARLGIEEIDLVDVAYIDLLESQG